MGTTPFQVIQYTRSPVAQITLMKVERKIQEAIDNGPGETFYDLTLYVTMPEEFNDNDIYAIVATLEHDGWANVHVQGGILYFNFPPVKGV